MTIFDVIHMARKARKDVGPTTGQWLEMDVPALERFAALVAAHEREALLAAQKQEPVAWSVFNKRTKKHWYTNDSKCTAQHYANEYSHLEPDGSPSMIVVPLYTALPKPEWTGLTDEELRKISDSFLSPIDEDWVSELAISQWVVEDFAKAISAKLKEKNHG
jgi:hypothetical protein